MDEETILIIAGAGGFVLGIALALAIAASIYMKQQKDTMPQGRRKRRGWSVISGSGRKEPR